MSEQPDTTSETEAKAEADADSSSSTSLLRSVIRPDFPEVDVLYSDAYLISVLAVPGRTFEYARDRKVRGALEWRRNFGVDELREAFAFRADDDGDGGVSGGDGGWSGEFVPVVERESAAVDEVDGTACAGGDASAGGADERGSSRPRLFRPSVELMDLCASRAFSVRGKDAEGRLVLHARTARVDWWRSGVDPGLQYHVLVIEHALELIRKAEEGELSESMVLLVDAEGQGIVPPPIGALAGLITLLQTAYPDRIHQIHVFPVNMVIRGLFDLVSPWMRPRSREKINLVASFSDLDESYQMESNVEEHT